MFAKEREAIHDVNGRKTSIEEVFEEVHTHVFLNEEEEK